MSSTEAKALAHVREPILPPYTPDPRRPWARLTRVLGFVGVCFFCLVWGFFYAVFAPAFLLFFIAPLPILAMVVIWALPDVRAAPLQALSNMLFVFMGCLVLWPGYIALAPPGIPWITMTRISGFPLVLLLLLCASTSAEFREKVGGAMKASPWVSGLFVAFTVLEGVSIGFSRNPFFSFDAFVNAQINWTTIFLVSLYVFQKPGRMESMVRLLWIMAIPVGIIAMFEARVRHPLWAGHIPSFLQIDDPSVERAMAGMSRGGVYRAAGTFGNALGLAEYVSLVLPFVLNYMIGPYRAGLRMAAAFSVPFLLIVVVVSGSRLGLVGCFLSIALTVLIWAVNKWRQDRGSLLAPLTALAFPAAFATCIVASFFVGAIRVRVWGGGDGGAASTQSRQVQFTMGWPKVLHAPWGHGIGMGAETLQYAPFGGLTIDSYYLDILLEFGFLGFLLYYGMFLCAAVQSAIASSLYKGKDPEVELLKPFAIALINFFIVKSVFSEISNHPIVFMILGMIVALLYRISREKPVESRAPAAEPPRPAWRGIPAHASS